MRKNNFCKKYANYAKALFNKEEILKEIQGKKRAKYKNNSKIAKTRATSTE